MKLGSKRLAFADFEVDLDRRRLFRGGEPVSLNAKTFDLLVALMNKRGEVIEKDELLNTVWDGQFVEEGNLAVHVSRLRKVFGESKNENEFIATIPGRGYSFVADIVDATESETVIQSHSVMQIVVEEEIVEDQPQGTLAETGSRAASRVKHERGSRLTFAGAAIVLAALLFGSFIAFRFFAGTDKLIFQQIEIRRLTSTGSIANAAISKDGKLIVYSHSSGEEESLWLAHTNGGEKVELRPATGLIYQSLQFSPDGNLIFYAAGSNFSNAALYKMPVFGGGPPLKIRDDVRRFSLSPDGKRIAVVDAIPEQGSVLTSFDTEGKDEKVVAALSDEFAKGWISPAWSPDGKKISVAASVAASDMGVFVVDATTGSIDRMGDFSWQAVRGLSWLNDGSGLVAVGVAQRTLLAQIWQISYPQGETRRVTSDLVDYAFVTSVTNDNSVVAVAETSQSNIWVSPADSVKDAKQVTFSSAGARIGWVGLSWTKDQRILYTSDANDGTTIWSVNADGTQPKQIIPSGGVNSFPTTSADGRYIVFQSNRSGRYAIWRADANGENMSQLTRDGIAAQPFVSPDGRWVIYNSSESGLGELFRIPVEGGQPERITSLQVGWAQISPNSRFIAALALINGIEKVAIFSIDGGDPVQVFDLPRLYNVRGGIRWAPDGRSLVYRDWKNGLWRQGTDGGAPRLMEGLPEEKLGNFGWSINGERFAYTRISSSRDAVLISTAK